VKLSIIVPALDEAEGIAPMLDSLAPLRARGAEVIVVDGGSRDATVEHALPRADCVLSSPPGRAEQMNAGAARASGDVLLFLHADSRLPAGADRLVIEGLKSSGREWGRFDVTIAGRQRLLSLVAFFMRMRSRLTGIATGDQAIFVRRNAFEAAGAFPPITLMEDIALCQALKRIGRPLCLCERVVTSGRRWEEHGVLRTVVLMWTLRLAFFFGADPKRLARRYGNA
jgi:rSAM/selenodomain-associated transferase 2